MPTTAAAQLLHNPMTSSTTSNTRIPNLISLTNSLTIAFHYPKITLSVFSAARFRLQGSNFRALAAAVEEATEPDTEMAAEMGVEGLAELGFGTSVFKGVVFASAGFAAGLVGTAISNGLIKLRKKMDPNFETPNEPPPTVLNALTWALHMGISSNLRYQTLNGIEFLLAKSTPPEVVFKSSVVVLRCLNNVLGGMSFVLLARMTGSQSVCSDSLLAAAEAGSVGGRW